MTLWCANILISVSLMDWYASTMRTTSVPWVLFTLLLLPCTFTQVGCGNLIKLARNTEQICTNIHLRQSNHVLEVHCGVCVTSLGVVLKCQFFSGPSEITSNKHVSCERNWGQKTHEMVKNSFFVPIKKQHGTIPRFIYAFLPLHFYFSKWCFIIMLLTFKHFPFLLIAESFAWFWY